MSILIVDADPLGVALWRQSFSATDYRITVAASFVDAQRLARSASVGALMIGISVPEESATDFILALRADGFPCPVVARWDGAHHADALQLFDAGADEVIQLPQHDVFFTARLHAIVQRARVAVNTSLRVGDLVIDLISHQVECGGEPIRMTARLYRLLEFLARRPGTTVRRSTLLAEVWRLQYDSGSNVVDVHIAQLRKRLLESGSGVKVRTVRGEGYTLVAS